MPAVAQVCWYHVVIIALLLLPSIKQHYINGQSMHKIISC